MTVIFGDCRESMRGMIACGVKVQCCITSPPYFNLRDYGQHGQLGLEETPDEFVQNLVEVFRLVRELLIDDGTLWLNLGDSYAAGGNGGHKKSSSFHGHDNRLGDLSRKRKIAPPGLKQKYLIGIPWRVALALQADGWYLRSDIIWSKPNPMPESVTDRPTKAHEYIFLLSKSKKYYYDHEAIKEPAAHSSIKRWKQNIAEQEGSDRVPGKTNGKMKAVGGPKGDKQRGHSKRHAGFNDRWDHMSKEEQASKGRNKRTVWTIATQPYKGAHFATFPPKLIEPCVLAGSRPNDIIFDPFFGSGTVGAVAQQFKRNWIGCELNRDYDSLQQARLKLRGTQS